MHVGEPGFGIRHRIAEPRGTSPPYTVRALRAALSEAVAWGAELVVVKGDMTWSARALQWEAVAAALASVVSSSGVPVVAALGNHDVGRRGVDGRPILAAAGVRVVDVDDAMAIDVPGARVVVASTAVPGLSEGAVGVGLRERIVSLAGDAPAAGCGGVIVMMHHYPDRFGRPTRYPKGIPHSQAALLLRELASVTGGNVLVTCGHSHRHRRYRREGVIVSEVGSTKDYPGVWAGYEVDPGGVSQIVHRIADPSVVAWTDRTARWFGGAWGLWTPGRRSWRCFRVDWR